MTDLCSTDVFLSIYLIEKQLRIDSLYIKQVLMNLEDKIISDNSLVYNDKYFINLRCLLYILFNYNKEAFINKKTINAKILNKIDSLNSIIESIIGYSINEHKNLDNHNEVLVFNNPQIASYVYILSKDNLEFKIGCSSNIIKRSITLIKERKSNLVLEALFYNNSFYNSYRLEQSLHSVYKEYNIQGEWFKYDEKILKRILRLNKNKLV